MADETGTCSLTRASARMKLHLRPLRRRIVEPAMERDPADHMPRMSQSNLYRRGRRQVGLQGPTPSGLAYSDTGGAGPTVVLLHGVLMNGSLWDEVVDGLRHEYRCIVPELPFGAHRVPMPDDANLSLESIATLIARFLVDIDVRDVTLVCNDWGGAQLVVSPGGSERVSNLVLVSCEAFDNYPPGLPGRLLCILAALPGGTCLSIQLLRPRWIRHLRLVFGSMSKHGIPDDLFLGWIHHARHNRKVRRDLTKYLRAVPKRKQLRKWAEQQRSFLGPVLIVWAREDKLMSPAHAERLAEHFEKSQLVWVDDSRTLIPIDQPRILTEQIRTFLAANSPPPATSSTAPNQQPQETQMERDRL